MIKIVSQASPNKIESSLAMHQPAGTCIVLIFKIHITVLSTNLCE